VGGGNGKFFSAAGGLPRRPEEGAGNSATVHRAYPGPEQHLRWVDDVQQQRHSGHSGQLAGSLQGSKAGPAIANSTEQQRKFLR